LIPLMASGRASSSLASVMQFCWHPPALGQPQAVGSATAGAAVRGKRPSVREPESYTARVRVEANQDVLHERGGDLSIFLLLSGTPEQRLSLPWIHPRPCRRGERGESQLNRLRRRRRRRLPSSTFSWPDTLDLARSGLCRRTVNRNNPSVTRPANPLSSYRLEPQVIRRHGISPSSSSSSRWFLVDGIHKQLGLSCSEQCRAFKGAVLRWTSFRT
jgi:hypothetical protein